MSTRTTCTTTSANTKIHHIRICVSSKSTVLICIILSLFLFGCIFPNASMSIQRKSSSSGSSLKNPSVYSRPNSLLRTQDQSHVQYPFHINHDRSHTSNEKNNNPLIHDNNENDDRLFSIQTNDKSTSDSNKYTDQSRQDQDDTEQVRISKRARNFPKKIAFKKSKSVIKRPGSSSLTSKSVKFKSVVNSKSQSISKSKPKSKSTSSSKNRAKPSSKSKAMPSKPKPKSKSSSRKKGSTSSIKSQHIKDITVSPVSLPTEKHSAASAGSAKSETPKTADTSSSSSTSEKNGFWNWFKGKKTQEPSSTATSSETSPKKSWFGSWGQKNQKEKTESSPERNMNPVDDDVSEDGDFESDDRGYSQRPYRSSGSTGGGAASVINDVSNSIIAVSETLKALKVATNPNTNGRNSGYNNNDDDFDEDDDENSADAGNDFRGRGRSGSGNSRQISSTVRGGAERIKTSSRNLRKVDSDKDDETSVGDDDDEDGDANDNDSNGGIDSNRDVEDDKNVKSSRHPSRNTKKTEASKEKSIDAIVGELDRASMRGKPIHNLNAEHALMNGATDSSLVDDIAAGNDETGDSDDETEDGEDETENGDDESQLNGIQSSQNTSATVNFDSESKKNNP